MKISFAIPFHNEKENLSILLPLIKKNLSKTDKFEFEVNLVDDLSNDGSNELCEKFIDSNISKVRFNLFKLKKKGFQSGALKKGFDESTGDYIICMDADLQDDPVHILNFIEKISNNYEIVIGVRKNRNAPSILTTGLKIYGIVSFEDEDSSNPLQTLEGWEKFTGGFLVGSVGAAGFAYLLIANFSSLLA